MGVCYTVLSTSKKYFNIFIIKKFLKSQGNDINPWLTVTDKATEFNQQVHCLNKEHSVIDTAGTTKQERAERGC